MPFLVGRDYQQQQLVTPGFLGEIYSISLGTSGTKSFNVKDGKTSEKIFWKYLRPCCLFLVILCAFGSIFQLLMLFSSFFYVFKIFEHFPNIFENF